MVLPGQNEAFYGALRLKKIVVAILKKLENEKMEIENSISFVALLLHSFLPKILRSHLVAS